MSQTSFLRLIVACLLGILLGFGFWYLKNTEIRFVSGVVSSPMSVLKNQSGRTNILLLGMGGEGHDGGDLTDSILLVSLDLTAGKAILIPIPRDLWVDSLAAKINTAYHYGNEKNPKSGLELAKSSVSEILGVPVDYSVALDFQGFVKAIDAVGGVDVDVANTFDDFEYPIPGQETALPESDRYEHIHFDGGSTHMDGSTALKFARSRHAQGDEGTDFARAARQEKIIIAFRNKIFSLGTIFSTETLGKLKDSVASSIDTDIGSSEQASLAKVLINLGSKENISSIVITDYLMNPKISKNYGGQWVLIPHPSLQELQTYVKTQLEK